jgi:hypothetical protein
VIWVTGTSVTSVMWINYNNGDNNSDKFSGTGSATGNAGTN